MRHLILTLEFPPGEDGGIARLMDETARALSEAGESVRILTRGRGREIRRHDASYPLTVTRMRGHHWQRKYAQHLRRALPKIAREEPEAVVHTATWEIAAFVMGVFRISVGNFGRWAGRSQLRTRGFHATLVNEACPNFAGL